MCLFLHVLFTNVHLCSTLENRLIRKKNIWIGCVHSCTHTKLLKIGYEERMQDVCTNSVRIYVHILYITRLYTIHVHIMYTYVSLHALIKSMQNRHLIKYNYFYATFKRIKLLILLHLCTYSVHDCKPAIYTADRFLVFCNISELFDLSYHIFRYIHVCYGFKQLESYPTTKFVCTVYLKHHNSMRFVFHFNSIKKILHFMSITPN